MSSIQISSLRWIFSLENKKKLHSANSGEYGGCYTCKYPMFNKNCWSKSIKTGFITFFQIDSSRYLDITIFIIQGSAENVLGWLKYSHEMWQMGYIFQHSLPYDPHTIFHWGHSTWIPLAKKGHQCRHDIILWTY